MRSSRLLAVLPVSALLSACVSSNSTPRAATTDDSGAPSLDGSFDALATDAAPGDSSSTTIHEAGAPTTFGAGSITSPQGIAIDPSTGAIWVASFAGGLVKFDATGTYQATFGMSGAGKIVQGVGVALDSKGNVFVGDYGAHDVVELDPNGAYVATFPAADAGAALGRVTGVAIDASDHLFVIDDDASLVLELDATGHVSQQFSTSQAGQPALAGSVGMHFDAAGNLWIADFYYHSFAQYAPTGQLLAHYGTSSATATPGGFAQPYGLTVDGNGNVWVVDTGNDDVQEFDGHGTFERLLGASGAGAGQLNGPSGVAVDGQGRVLVSDGSNDRIVVFTP